MVQALPTAVQPTVVIASVAFSSFDALGIDDASVTRHIEQADTEAALRRYNVFRELLRRYLSDNTDVQRLTLCVDKENEEAQKTYVKLKFALWEPNDDAARAASAADANTDVYVLDHLAVAALRDEASRLKARSLHFKRVSADDGHGEKLMLKRDLRLATAVATGCGIQTGSPHGPRSVVSS